MHVELVTQIKWLVKPTRDGTVVGICDLLGLTLEAENEAELKSLIHEGQHVLFSDLLEDGGLAEFLRDRGWTARQQIPVSLPEDGVVFDVPFELG